jgi:hypothetical protein
MTHTTSETGAQRERKRKRRAHPLSPTRGRMLRRLCELQRLAAFRAHHRVPLGDPDAWAMAIAEVCLYHRDGCDLLSFQKVQPDPLPISDDDALAAIHRVCRVAAWKGVDYRPTRAATVGRNLDVTAEERWACDIRTMRAVDETPADAEAERKERDRERKRRKRRAADKQARKRERERGRRRRTAKGARPRAESLSRTRPWEARGISRSTWERRRRAARTSAPARDANSSVRHILRPGERTDEFASILSAARASSARNGHGESNGKHGPRRRRRPPTKEGTSEQPLATATPRPSHVVHLEAVSIG